MHPNRETVRTWKWTKDGEYVQVTCSNGRVASSGGREPRFFWDSSGPEVHDDPDYRPYTPTDADIDSLCEFLERKGIEIPAPAHDPLGDESMDAFEAKQEAEIAAFNRRRERLEVASRIAAGILSADRVYPAMAVFAEDVLRLTDALIAAVDAEPGKPASEVEFKPEGGAS
jgi:hypothetical protein